MASCPECGSDDLELDGVLDDGRRRIRCDVGHEFLLGTAAPKSAAGFNSLAEARKRFPTSDDVDKARLARVDALKAQFLKEHPEPQPAVAAYWAHYQDVFSQDGLQVCDPKDLKDFANNSIGANPGNQSGFNTAWNEMGVAAAVDQTRGAIDYLLYGPDSIPLEDRLTDLIDPSFRLGMRGFREALLTRVLCVMQPDRFIPILTYSSTEAAGKREIANLVYALDLPEAARVSWTIGRLIIWSNDILLTLAGDGFAHMQHVAQFLWDAKESSTSLK
jgi:hypothetical protein